MSLLLDALRKSEHQRNLGTAPNIHLPPGEFNAGKTKPTRRYLVYLLILLALLAIWVWVLFQSDTEVLEGTSNQPDEAPIGSEKSIPIATLPPQGEPDQDQDQASADVDDFSVPAPINKREGASRPVAQVKTEPESIGTAIDAVKPEPPQTAEQVLTEVDTSVNTENNDHDKIAAERLATLKQRLADDEQGKPNETVAEVSRQAAVLPTSPTEPAIDESSAVSGVLSYFDLPINVRQKLPKLSRSLQVYDADPEKRFVVINQQRLVEGDSFDDIVLVEIRRDSVILDYQVYRFEYQ